MARRALTDEERAARQQRQREIVERSVEQLRTSAGWQQWLRTRKAFRRYSLRNQLLIAAQCETATHVAGFRKWLKLGYCVRRGQGGIYIWAPMPPSKKRLAEWEAAGRPKDKKPRTHFGLTSVFDRSQVDELPPPSTPMPLDLPAAPITGDELASHLPALIALAQTFGYRFAVDTTDGAAEGYCSHDRKHVAVSDTLEPNGRMAVAVHELAHLLVRADQRDGDPEMAYATEEWVAETVAFMVADTLGLDTAAASVPYLASWSEGLDAAVLEATAALIDRLSRHIEDVVLADDEAEAAA
jgi:antirestriction protein ArdC